MESAAYEQKLHAARARILEEAVPGVTTAEEIEARFQQEKARIVGNDPAVVEMLARAEARHEKLAADEQARREAAEARERQRIEDQWATERASRRHRYIANGGDPARFDADWPDMKAKLIEGQLADRDRAASREYDRTFRAMNR